MMQPSCQRSWVHLLRGAFVGGKVCVIWNIGSDAGLAESLGEGLSNCVKEKSMQVANLDADNRASVNTAHNYFLIIPTAYSFKIQHNNIDNLV